MRNAGATARARASKKTKKRASMVSERPQAFNNGVSSSVEDGNNEIDTSLIHFWKGVQASSVASKDRLREGVGISRVAINAKIALLGDNKMVWMPMLCF